MNEQRSGSPIHPQPQNLQKTGPVSVSQDLC